MGHFFCVITFASKKYVSSTNIFCGVLSLIYIKLSFADSTVSVGHDRSSMITFYISSVITFHHVIIFDYFPSLIDNGGWQKLNDHQQFHGQRWMANPVWPIPLLSSEERAGKSDKSWAKRYTRRFVKIQKKHFCWKTELVKTIPLCGIKTNLTLHFSGIWPNGELSLERASLLGTDAMVFVSRKLPKKDVCFGVNVSYHGFACWQKNQKNVQHLTCAN